MDIAHWSLIAFSSQGQTMKGFGGWYQLLWCISMLRGVWVLPTVLREKRKKVQLKKKKGGGVFGMTVDECVLPAAVVPFFCCLKLANRCLEWWYVNCTIHPQEGTDDVGALPSPRVVLLICVVDRALHLNPQCGSIRNLLSLLLLL